MTYDAQVHPTGMHVKFDFSKYISKILPLLIYIWTLLTSKVNFLQLMIFKGVIWKCVEKIAFLSIFSKLDLYLTFGDLYYWCSNKRPGSFIKSEKDFHPGRFLFQAARKIIVVPLHQNNNDRSGILNRFIDQENLQMYAQMDGILFCHWNNTQSIVLTNGKIHYVMF